jgi:hypothetical protein
MYRIEPFGNIADDRRHGIAVSVLANVNRDPKRRPEPYHANDFMLGQEPSKQTGEAVLLDPEAQSQLIKQRIFKV